MGGHECHRDKGRAGGHGRHRGSRRAPGSVCCDLWGPVRSHHTRGRAARGGKHGANFPAPLIQHGERGRPRGVASPALSAGRRERGLGTERAREGEPRCAGTGKGGTAGPEGAPCPQRERGAEARPRPQTRGKFPQTLARGSRPPSAIPSRRPRLSGCSRPRRRGRGALFPAPRRVFPLTPRSPRLLTPPRLRIPPPQPALGLFHLPHPHRFIPIIAPEVAGGCGKGNASPTPFL